MPWSEADTSLNAVSVTGGSVVPTGQTVGSVVPGSVINFEQEMSSFAVEAELSSTHDLVIGGAIVTLLGSMDNSSWFQLAQQTVQVPAGGSSGTLEFAATGPAKYVQLTAQGQTNGNNFGNPGTVFSGTVTGLVAAQE